MNSRESEQLFYQAINLLVDYLENSALESQEFHSVLFFTRVLVTETRTWRTGPESRPTLERLARLGSRGPLSPQEEDKNA
jgi:hypothetical protein